MFNKLHRHLEIINVELVSETLQQKRTHLSIPLQRRVITQATCRHATVCACRVTYDACVATPTVIPTSAAGIASVAVAVATATPPFHGRQFAQQHGQRCTEEADREHEVPGVHGTLAPIKKHRRDARIR